MPFSVCVQKQILDEFTVQDAQISKFVYGSVLLQFFHLTKTLEAIIKKKQFSV